MALRPAVLDIPLSTTNQVTSDTMGPLGALRSMADCQVKRYEPHFQGAQGVVPAKIMVEPRDAFNSLPAAARSVIAGTTVSPTWDKQRLLAELDTQLVAICGGSEPRVFNGSTWSTYVNNAILTEKLSQEVFHTSQKTIQCPDAAWLSGVTCSVWTETSSTSAGPRTTSYVGFRSDNGAWLVKPTALYTSGTVPDVAQAKVVQDGTVFWVFYNTDTTIAVNVYDIHGALLGTNSPAIPLPLHHAYASGTWDITACPTSGGYTVLCAVEADYTSSAGVDTYALKWTGAAIASSHVLIGPGSITSGWLSFLTNDTGNGSAYLASTVAGTPESVYVYEITNQAISHPYASVTISSDNVDTVAGYVADAVSRTVVISCGLFAGTSTGGAATNGPKYDPQLRTMKTFSITIGNVVTPVRTTQSMAQISRAFAIDGNYYTIGYYQSGAGLSWQPTTISPTIQSGDYMIGAAVQPVTVTAGDSVIGSPVVTTSGSVNPQVAVTSAAGAQSIAAGDTVTLTYSSGASAFGIPDGTAVLKWSFTHQPSNVGSMTGSRLIVSGSSIPAANGTWDIVYLPSSGTHFYTPLTGPNGGVALTTSGTFTAAGTVQVQAMAVYETRDLDSYIGDETVLPFIGGTLTVTGASHSGNNGTFGIARVYYGSGQNFGYFTNGASNKGAVWTLYTTQVTSNDLFSATLTPNNANMWTFSNDVPFDSTYVGADLVVTDDPALPGNLGTYPITLVVTNTNIFTQGATSLISQRFGLPLPAVEVALTTQIPYTFKLQSVVPDYTYIGAIVSVQGATTAANNGTYKITQINADGTFVALPTNGLSNQVNEAFTGAQTIKIYISPNPAPEFQSTWFVVPLTGAQPVAGRFEYGLAYADWRTEGDPTYSANIFIQGLTRPVATTSGTMVVLPYRAQNVTSAVDQITAAGAVDIGETTYSSTVGLKQFWFGAPGHAYANSGELLLPGPMASVYTSSGFFEDGINVAPEQPFLVSQSVAATGTLGITLGAERIYVVVFEFTDENGNRIYSPPSPPLVVNMSGSNNVATIGGRSPFPLGSTGGPVASTFGPTCRNVTISIYATAYVNGAPTTIRYKITNDLYANGLAPATAANPSGFSFPDSFTWQYRDQNPDGQIQANEVLYVDKGYLPRYPAPAFSTGTAWRNRQWVIGYDGAIWMSGEKTEGDAIWFNPAFRYVLPTDDEPLGLAAMEDYLIITCANSIWYIPAAQFPDATGSNGTLPTPVRLPFQNGSVNGLTQTIREGVAYDSSAGGLWLITRNLDNVWLSHPVLDTLATPIIDLALDQQQRLFVLQQSGPIMVYDGIPAAWYAWRAPTTGVLLATYAGQVAYQDATNVNAVVTGQGADLVAGVTYGIAPDITLAPLSIGNVRGLKRVWEFQAIGTYYGPHRLNVVLSYPEDDQQPTTTYAPFTPSATKPYVIPFNPLLEEAAQFGIRIYADFVGIDVPGKTFALEMVSAQVGMEPGVGLKKLPPGLTLLASS